MNAEKMKEQTPFPRAKDARVNNFADLRAEELEPLKALAAAACVLEFSEDKLNNDLLRGGNGTVLTEEAKKLLKRFLAAPDLTYFTYEEKRELAALLAAGVLTGLDGEREKQFADIIKAGDLTHFTEEVKNKLAVLLKADDLPGFSAEEKEKFDKLLKTADLTRLAEEEKNKLAELRWAGALAAFTKKKKNKLAALLSPEQEEILTPLLKDVKKKVGVSGDEIRDIRNSQADMGHKLTGLAFSGGGIRSATFNLGVLQALAECGLLTRFDYLSTVSGGGYIGSWLSAWIWRERQRLEEERWEREWKEQRATQDKSAVTSPGRFAKVPGSRCVTKIYSRWIEADEKKKWMENRKKEEGQDESSFDASEAAASVQEVLAKSADDCAQKGDPVVDESVEGSACSEPKQISFLRSFSNYLTPRLGLFSYDTLAAIVTIIRNCLLNQTVLVLALASLLLLPREVALLGSVIRESEEIALCYAKIAGFLLFWALIWINLNLFEQQREGGGELCWFVKPSWIFVLIQAPIVASAMIVGFVAAALPANYIQDHWYPIYLLILVLCSAAWFVALVAKWVRARFSASDLKKVRTTVTESLGGPSLLVWNAVGLFAGVTIAVALLILLQKIFHSGESNAAMDHWQVAVWGMPSALGVFALTFTAQIGIVGWPLSEGSREWWARLGGVLVGIVIAWIAVAACALYAPFWVISLYNWISDSVAVLGLAWVVSTIAGLVTAFSARTGKQGSRKPIEIFTRFAPYVFIAGLLVLLSAAMYLLIAFVAANPAALTLASKALTWLGFEYAPSSCTVNPSLFELASAAITWTRYEYVLNKSSCALLLGVAMAFSFLAALFLSWRVNIDLFSLHNFYKNRLERCYLGASNQKRRSNPFTGFDPNDAVRLEELDQRPYHIVNTAINLTHSKRLAWQERKAASFVFTPLYCGYELNGKAPVHAYQQTAHYVRDLHKKRRRWITLSRALAVSGTAFSPNMGYHSTPAVSCLLTVFNLRLGAWMENPRKGRVWRKSRSLVGLLYLLRELFGATDEDEKFVYLSDGGHFENLGIYELVRRRCRFIVACDASMDKSYTFEDLGNAVRKCHNDLGVPIRIDARAIVPDTTTGRSRFHCAIGTIHYEHAYPLEPPGYLLYIKPSLTGSEPIDVRQYASAHVDFPHEPTPDQWFTESQFESYRRLGYKVGRTVFEATEEDRPRDMESLLESLKQQWYPPSTRTREAFTKHGDQLIQLHENLRTDRNLEFLSGQIFPEWPVLMGDVEDTPMLNLWLPSTSDEMRAGYYFCAKLLQLMENVYLDLNLQDEYEHPDNRGWMNLFRRCSWSSMFRVTYAIAFSTYGARFQQFCRDRFSLSEGEIDVKGKFQFYSQNDVDLYLNQAEKSRELNFLEKELIQVFQAAHLGFNCIIPLRLCVANPMADEQKQWFSFGFALARTRDMKIVYLRVQDHLRKSGLARRAKNALDEEREFTWVNSREEEGGITPYRKYLDSLTPADRVKFIKRYGNDPDTFRRMLGPV